MHGIDLPSAAALAYLAICALTAFDVFFPVLPGEGTLMAAGALTVTGDLEIPLVILAGALGALAGDLASYQVGRRLRRRADRPRPRAGGSRLGRFRPDRFRPDRFRPGRPRPRPGAALLARLGGAVPGLTTGWPERFQRHGGLVLFAARLVPGGRTAATLAAGRLAYSRRRFAATELAIDAGWAAAATLLGYLGATVLPAGLTPERLLLIAEVVLFIACLTLGARLWRVLNLGPGSRRS
ncbi:membrane protein DedA with SNARE-associated domain [Thermocatellispora tengchongensis]|uniref:Membrane protein DedA with SNARE-associated domain n=1 Tax=Thermocatellispora tengchongensis TaxID=1073253 RepID=A0A840PW26_9ACTN|nr:VTT domain-containing protein [Thermocatellispora tengchongensis]MBB5140085.1 membrane protein DedA with SNARE-associated domain [Thermocatellispora tengchongensis]